LLFDEDGVVRTHRITENYYFPIYPREQETARKKSITFPQKPEVIHNWNGVHST